MMFWADFLISPLGSMLSLIPAVPAWLVFALLERFGPVYGERLKGVGAHINGAVFQLVGTAIGAFPVFLLWHWFPRPHPLIPALALPIAILIADFFMYWQHRFEHRFLWRFHAVHHATRDLAGTSNFNHFLHGLFMQTVYAVPLGFLTDDPFAIPILSTLLYVDATFVHSPTKLGIGPLRWVLNDNRIHRIHHAIDESLHDRNFGAIFTFWDFLFGTMHWPSKDEWPDTGVADYGEIETVSDFLLLPFQMRHPRIRFNLVSEKVVHPIK